MTSFNLADLFESVVDAVPQRTALIAGDVTLSYAQLEDRANRLARHLQAAGFGLGDHIGIYAYNRAEWVEAMWACFKIRAVPVNINFRYVEDELRYIFDNADLQALIYEAQFTPLLENIAPQLPQLRHFIVIDNATAVVDSVIAALPYEAALAQHSGERLAITRRGDDLYMLYTGGTTGMPKGTMWSHEDLFYAALQGGNPGGEAITSPEQLAPLAAASEFTYAAVCPVPMMHGGGAWYCMIYQLSGNIFVLYCEPHYDPDKVLELIAKTGAINLIIAGDAMGRPLAESIANGRHDTSSLLVLGSGGAILSKTVKNQLKKLLPNTMIFDSFGASEIGSGGIVMDQNDDAAGPVFTLAANTAILDEETLQPLPPGSDRRGLLARCGNIPRGYYKDPEKTAQTIRTDANGTRWVIPGDYARVLADGTAELLGRGSVSINSGAEKIFPEEVEAVLKAHPDIYDAGVVGVPDERWGAKVVAIARPRDGATLDPQQVFDFCRGKIASYKIPRELIICQEIPRTPIAKPDYRKLKALALAELGLEEPGL